MSNVKTMLLTLKLESATSVTVPAANGSFIPLLCFEEMERPDEDGALSDEFLIIAAQQLHAQSDALVPLPGDDADVPGVERRLE